MPRPAEGRDGGQRGSGGGGELAEDELASDLEPNHEAARAAPPKGVLAVDENGALRRFKRIGVMVQAAGMLRAKVLPRWQPGALLVSLPFIGFPDGAEIINLTAALVMTAAMLPHRVKLLRSGTGAAIAGL